MRTGKIIQVSGSVVDVRFPHGELPRIREALSVELNGKRLVMEVEQHLSAETVRCIMLSGSEGLSRGMTVTGEGSGLRVPVGKATLGRLFNVFGDTIDGGAPISGAALGSIRETSTVTTIGKTIFSVLETVRS